MLYFHLYKIFFSFFLFSEYDNVYSKFFQPYKTISVTETRYIISENYYKRTRFSKENNSYSTKHQKRKDLQLFETKLTEK